MKHVINLVFVLVLFAANFSISINYSTAACLEPPSGMVGWWPGDGSILDYIGSNHGELRNVASFRSSP